MDLLHEISELISGIGKSPKKNTLEAAAFFLATSKRSDSYSSKDQLLKTEETTRLIPWVEQQRLWVKMPEPSRYLTRGAEQRVFLDTDGKHVIKLNDAIFYASWEEYFHCLLIHNLLFPGTSYQLLGFCIDDSVLYAVVKQRFVAFTEATDLSAVEKIMTGNGFLRKKNNDYYHPQAHLLIEDLHEENVLTNNGILFFIDTVIYWRPTNDDT